MITKETYNKIRSRVLELYNKAGIVLTPKEKESVEVADMGLHKIETFGLQLVMYVNTERVCAKELALLPHQTCPEHKHPPLGNGNPGKEETFRCRYGTVYLYVSGEPTGKISAQIPEGEESNFTAFHEIILKPGDQYTLVPNTWHWFQAGDEGAVVSEFSTRSTDENDLFTDPRISRIPVVEK